MNLKLITGPVDQSVIGLEFDQVRAFVAESWSNIAVEREITKLGDLLRPMPHPAQLAYRLAVRTARHSGTPARINECITELQDAMKAE